MDDPYRTLGVDKKASTEQIKAAYRKLAKKLHPDLNPGNAKIENQFKEKTAAYEFLSDPERKRAYDTGQIDANGQPRFRQAQAGPWGQQSAQQGGSFHFDEGSAGAGEDIFRDFFSFGRGRESHGRMRGTDVNYRADIDFIDAAIGGKKRLTLADGKVLNVNIPSGSESGQTLRLKGQGLAGISGGPAGDAFLELQVRAHPYFTRQGLDLFIDVPITLHEAALGANVTVPTLTGKVNLRVPPYTSSGTQLRLKGKGIAKDGMSGDQFVRLMIVLPPSLDPELKAAIEKSAPQQAFNPRSKFGE